MPPWSSLADQHDDDVVLQAGGREPDEIHQGARGQAEIGAGGDAGDLGRPGVAEQAVAGDEEGGAGEWAAVDGKGLTAGAEQRLAALAGGYVVDACTVQQPGSGVADAGAMD